MHQQHRRQPDRSGGSHVLIRSQLRGSFCSLVRGDIVLNMAVVHSSHCFDFVPFGELW